MSDNEVITEALDKEKSALTNWSNLLDEMHDRKLKHLAMFREELDKIEDLVIPEFVSELNELMEHRKYLMRKRTGYPFGSEVDVRSTINELKEVNMQLVEMFNRIKFE